MLCRMRAGMDSVLTKAHHTLATQQHHRPEKTQPTGDHTCHGQWHTPVVCAKTYLHMVAFLVLLALHVGTYWFALHYEGLAEHPAASCVVGTCRPVLIFLSLQGGGSAPPPPPDQSDHHGERNLQSGNQAHFGTQTFGSQTPLPRPPLFCAQPGHVV